MSNTEETLKSFDGITDWRVALAGAVEAMLEMDKQQWAEKRGLRNESMN